MVKKNLRSFAGFEFAKGSAEYKKKYDSIKKLDNKALRSICEILVLDRKGSKDDITSRVIKFLMEPDELLCVEQGDDEEEEIDEDEIDEDEEDAASEEDKKRKSNKPSAGRGSARNSTGRPKRSTAGKSKKHDTLNIFTLIFNSHHSQHFQKCPHM